TPIEHTKGVEEQQQSLLRYTRVRAKSVSEGLAKRQLQQQKLKMTFDVKGDENLDCVELISNSISTNGNRVSDEDLNHDVEAEDTLSNEFIRKNTLNSSIPIPSNLIKTSAPIDSNDACDLKLAESIEFIGAGEAI